MSECILFSQELEEVSKQLIKAKMTSVIQTHSPTGKEQQIQQLHQKLIMVKDNRLTGLSMVAPRLVDTCPLSDESKGANNVTCPHFFQF